jgi:hypothetical protein
VDAIVLLVGGDMIPQPYRLLTLIATREMATATDFSEM